MSDPSPPLRVAVITEGAMNRKHGTGVQLLRLFDGDDYDWFNFYLNDQYGSPEGKGVSLASDDFKWWYGGQSVAGKVRARVRSAWHEKLIYPRQIQTALLSRQFDVAYVVITDEARATFSLPILRQLNVPYAVHIMDILDEKGFAPKQCPNLGYLLRGAAPIWATTEAIGSEIERFGVKASVLRVAQTAFAGTASPPPSPLIGSLRLAMIGGLYKQGICFLEEAWPHLKATYPIELHYAGNWFESLPPALKRDGTNHGQITEPKRLHQFLCDNHLAYLSGPSELDWAGRFSYPSRTTDYFMAGLPTLACVTQGTVTREILQPLAPQTVQFTENAEQFAPSIAALLQTWVQGSHKARAFALENFDIQKARLIVRTHLLELRDRNLHVNRS